MEEGVKVAFASGTREQNVRFIDRLAELDPELPLYVVAEFPPHQGKWIPYHVYRTFGENLEGCRAALKGKRLRRAAMILSAGGPYGPMRRIALVVSRGRVRIYMESGVVSFLAAAR